MHPSASINFFLTLLRVHGILNELQPAYSDTEGSLETIYSYKAFLTNPIPQE